MENSRSKTHKSIASDDSVKSSVEANGYRLGAFFDLLLRIDKRNHPELYAHNESGASPDQAAKRSHGLRLRGD